MTDSSVSDSTTDTAQANAVTNISGGVSLDAERIDIGGDVVGRDKIETTNIYLTLDAASTFGVETPVAVGKGLLVLGELMQRSAKVRSDVSAFRADFRAAHEQIDVLSDYKDLHDLLHRLQFHCYSGLLLEARKFPDDADAVFALSNYALTLDSLVVELRRVAGRSRLPHEETSWVDTDVAAAQGDLNTALDKLDEKLLRLVIRRLKRVLDTQPSVINTLLNHTARVLRLHDLAEALTRICDGLAALELEADKVQQFEAGVTGLRQLDRGFMALVSDHNLWQKLDLELRSIDGTLDQDLVDLEMSWPHVKTIAEPLYTTVAGKWAQDLQKESRGLDEALAAGNPIKIKNSFRLFQRRVSERFFQVDVDLKSVCGDLRQIGVPLDSVLGMIE